MFLMLLLLLLLLLLLPPATLPRMSHESIINVDWDMSHSRYETLLPVPLATGAHDHGGV